MKNTFLIWLAFLSIADNAFAQDKFKFGNASDNLVRMTSYKKDTSASAVILHKECYVWYNLVDDEFQLSTTHTVQIKILKQAGTSWADFEIPYYYPELASGKETVSNISGFSYNLEGGQVKKTKLSKEYIFDEKAGENHHVKKISFPNVKAGSVIELKYTCQSPHYTHLDSYELQSTIPVAYVKYQAVIPKYFRFSKKTLGFEKIKYTENTRNLSFWLKSGAHIVTDGSDMSFEGWDLPSLKDDSYVWNKKDFISKIDLDLAEHVAKTGFGDCKALSNYMRAMLDAVGIPSIYTVISTVNTDIFTDFANLNQMNHVILAVPSGKDTLWLECTSTFNPFNYVHDDIAGHQALLIFPDGGKLQRVKANDPIQITRNECMRLEVAENGNAKATAIGRYKQADYEDMIPFLYTMDNDERINFLGQDLFSANKILMNNLIACITLYCKLYNHFNFTDDFIVLS